MPNQPPSTQAINTVLQFAMKDEDGEIRGVVASILAHEGKFQQALALIKKVKKPTYQVYHLCQIISEIAKSGNKELVQKTQKQAVEFAQKNEEAWRKAMSLSMVALMLATEPLPKNIEFDPEDYIDRKMKKTFTPQEKQLAKQIAQTIQAN